MKGSNREAKYKELSKYIDKKGEGMHHIAFEVPDIVAEMERLKKEGFTLLNESPKKSLLKYTTNCSA